MAQPVRILHPPGFRRSQRPVADHRGTEGLRRGRELWRLLASLERLDPATRVKIGDEVVRRLHRDEDNASLLWSIGRLGARTPIYGPLTSVVAASDAGRWLEELVANRRSTPELFAAIVQIGALTGDPLRDLDELAADAARQR